MADKIEDQNQKLKAWTVSIVYDMLQDLTIINEGSDDIDTAHLPKVITKYFLNLIKCLKFIFLDLCIENSMDLCVFFIKR